jgi:hypothetical protein
LSPSYIPPRVVPTLDLKSGAIQPPDVTQD